MSLVLHSYRRCPFAIRVRMVLEEKQIPYETVEENLSNFSARLLELHPEAKVPLLIHNGQAIHESAVITEYLDEAFPQNPLMPTDPGLRARVRLWTHWANQLLKPDLDGFKYEWKRLEPGPKAELHARLRKRVAELGTALEHQPFLMGRDLTLADIHVFPFYRQLQKSQPDFAQLLQPTAATEEWLARITSRPSFERVMAKR